MKIAVVVGSLRAESYNKKLAGALVGYLPSEYEIVWVSPEAPFMNQDLEANPPRELRDVADTVAACDGVLLVSPEYNRGIPGIVKNWLDWMSRESMGRPLSGKRGAIAGVSTGMIGTAVMQSQLRPVLAHIGMEIMAQPSVFVSVPQRMNSDGSLPDATSQTLQNFMQAFVSYVRR